MGHYELMIIKFFILTKFTTLSMLPHRRFRGFLNKRSYYKNYKLKDFMRIKDPYAYSYNTF